jgi:hypothetical protein
MKKSTAFILGLLFIAVSTFSLYPQKIGYAIGAHGAYYLPIGSLSDRFKPTMGGAVTVDFPGKGNPAWSATFEYLVFREENYDRLFLTRNVEVNSVAQPFVFPLPKLTMQLEIAGLTANAAFPIYTTQGFESNIAVGFGIYRWLNRRSEYFDTLKVDTTGSGAFKTAVILGVPEQTQLDWSGGFNVGLDVNVEVFEPVSITLGIRYKMIVAELWPTLNLDLENVSTLMMLDARVGFKIKL